MKEVAVVILAGGKGSRLYPLTKECAKPALTFAGKVRLIDIPIYQSISAGIEDIYVLTQHLSKTIHQHLQEQHPKVHILAADALNISYEGTADAIRKTLDYYQKYKYILILSGDQIYKLNFRNLLKLGIKTDADALVATLPIAKKDAKRLGIMKIDTNQKIVDFAEKPTKPELVESFIQPHPLDPNKPILGSMGIYFFKKKVLTKLLKENHGEDFGKHIIPKQLQKCATFAYIHEGYWEDIGTIASYWQANLELTKPCADLKNHPANVFASPLSKSSFSKTKMNNSIICDETTIHAKEITSSIVGSGYQIDQGSILENCILCGKQSPKDSGGFIGKDCLIKDAIIDKNVVIGRSVHLINKNKFKEYEDQNIVIKDGVIIVKANSKIEDGFTL